MINLNKQNNMTTYQRHLPTTRATRKLDKLMRHHGVKCTIDTERKIVEGSDLLPMRFVGNGVWYVTSISKLICNDKKALKGAIIPRVLDAMEKVRERKNKAN